MRKGVPGNLDVLIFEDTGFLFNIDSIFDTFTVDEEEKEECQNEGQPLLNTLEKVASLKKAYSHSMWNIPLKSPQDLVAAVERRMVRPLLSDKKIATEDIPELLGCTSESTYVFALEKVPENTFEYRYVTSFCKEARDIPVMLKVFTSDGHIPDVAYGPSYSKLSHKWQATVGWFKREPDKKCYTQTISKAIAEFVVLNELDKKLHEIVTLPQKERESNLVYNKMKEYEKSVLFYKCGVTDANAEDFTYYVYAEDRYAKDIAGVLNSYGFSFSYVSEKEKSNIELAQVAFSAIEMNSKIGLRDVIEFHKVADRQYLLLGEWSLTKAFGFVSQLRNWLVKQAESVMEVVKDVEYSRKSYARSYETKKNISYKYKKEMENSRFHEVFGFVEYDCSVELDKAKRYADEVCAFKKKVLAGFDFKDKSIRLRKLGNHKAVGLYYPGLSCLCVDVRHPEAITHEIGHMIDYGDLSSPLSMRAEFYEIKELYSSLLKKAVKNSKRDFKGKYNLAYYLKGTEVFARCFELYVSEVLDIKGSICESTLEGEEYPKDRELLDLIEIYFNSIRESVAKKREKGGGRNEQIA